MLLLLPHFFVLGIGTVLKCYHVMYNPTRDSHEIPCASVILQRICVVRVQTEGVGVVGAGGILHAAEVGLLADAHGVAEIRMFLTF